MPIICALLLCGALLSEGRASGSRTWVGRSRLPWLPRPHTPLAAPASAPVARRALGSVPALGSIPENAALLGSFLESQGVPVHTWSSEILAMLWAELRTGRSELATIERGRFSSLLLEERPPPRTPLDPPLDPPPTPPPTPPQRAPA